MTENTSELWFVTHLRAKYGIASFEGVNNNNSRTVSHPIGHQAKLADTGELQIVFQTSVTNIICHIVKVQ